MTIGLVGQDQITTFTSPVNGTSPIDANTVRGNDNTVKTAFNVHDKDPTIHFQSSLAAARPPAGVPGRKWLDTDTRRVYYDDGVTWNEIAYLAAGGGGGTGIPGPVVITGGGITTDGGITAAGDITAGGNVIAHTLFIAEGTAAQNRGTVARTAGVTRWFVGANAAAETGGNAGSDLSIAAYSDAGALLRESFVVKRDTGVVTITAPSVTATGVVIVGTDPGGAALLRVGGTAGSGNIAVFYNANAAAFGPRILAGGGANYSLSVETGAAAQVLVVSQNIINATASAFVIGTDPGGAGKLRVGGDINVGSAVRTSGGAHMLSYDAPTTTVAVGSGNPDALDLYGGGLRRMRFGTDGSVTIGTTTGGGGILTLGAQTPSANATAAINITASNTTNNWRIGYNQTVVGALEFAPSTVAGGTAFSTPSFHLYPGGGGLMAAPFCVAGISGAGMARIGVGVENGYVTGAGFEFTYSTAALAATITAYDRGALALRKLELQASAYAFIGLGGGSGILSVGAADSGGAGFRTVRVPN